jgi:uncharacterized protein YndB with AHSA1/START domain
VAVKRFSIEHDYAAPVERVFGLLTDESFLRERLEALGARDIAIEESSPTQDGGQRVVVRRTVTVELPGFAARVLSPSNTVTQTDEWEAERDGRRSGRWQVEVSGVPARTAGSMSLVPSADGCRYVLHGEVKISVPLIGGRLESFAVDNATRDLDREHEFTAAWLSRSGT